MVIGFSWPASHDNAASAIVDGRLVFATEEERYTRERYSIGQPALNSMAALFRHLRKIGIGPRDVDAFAVNFDPALYPFLYKAFMFYHSLGYSRKYLGGGSGHVAEGMEAFFGGLDYGRLARRLVATAARKAGEDPPANPRIIPVRHHLAHAASAYYFSGFGTACAITIDGVGESESTTVWRVKNGEFENIASVSASEGSIGLLYEYTSAKLGLGYFAGPGKVMGLAPYGGPSKYLERFRRLVKLREGRDKPYRLATDRRGLSSGSFYRGGYARLHRAYLDGIFGQISWNPYNEISGDAADVAYAIQSVTEEVVIAAVEFAKSNTNCDSVVLAGGVALNAKANMEIFYSKVFNEFFVFPAANDAGTTIGAAAYVHANVLGIPMRNERLRTVSLGPGYDDDQVKAAVRETSWRSEYIGEDVGIVAELLSQGRVLGWYQGRAELGPRALGNRSIVADPRDTKTRDRINRLKGREWWRPLAPSLLEGELGRYFRDAAPHEFMVMMYRMLEEGRKSVPAVCHIDGTTRPQTLTPELNGPWFELVRAFKELTGEGAVVNTSFNLGGEPLVETPAQALASFKRGGFDGLYLQGWLLSK